MKTILAAIAFVFATGCAVPIEVYSYEPHYYTDQRIGKVISVQPITRKEYVDYHPLNIEPCVWKLQRERNWGYLTDALTKHRYQSVCYDHKHGSSYGVIRYITGFSVRVDDRGYRHTVRLNYAPQLGSYIRY